MNYEQKQKGGGHTQPTPRACDGDQIWPMTMRRGEHFYGCWFGRGAVAASVGADWSLGNPFN